MQIKKHDFVIPILCLLIGFFLYSFIFPVRVKFVEVDVVRDSTRVERDTMWITENPSVVYKPGKIVYRTLYDTAYFVEYDTIIESRPFTATIYDTVKVGDTLGIHYEFPENVFTIMRKPQPQMKEIEIQYVYKTKTKIIEDAWWIKPAIGMGSGILGYGLGRIR